MDKVNNKFMIKIVLKGEKLWQEEYLIVAALVLESLSKHPNEIEQEILKEINNGHLIIP